jgi:signal transduction histidine kinase
VHQRVRIVAAVAVVGGSLLLLPEAWFSPGVQVATSASAAALSLAVAVLAGARYRVDRDPHALFLSVGFAVVAVQAAVFGVGWPIRHEGIAMAAVTLRTSVAAYAPVRSLSGAAPVYAFQVGWLVAGICFVLGVPWWDRRGHRAIRGWLVGISAGGIVALTDRLLATWYPRPSGPGAIVAVRVPIEAGTIGWAIGIAAAAVLAFAAGRELFRRSDPPHPWIGVAFAASVALPLSAIGSPTQGLAYVQWADVLQVIVPGIAFAALVATHRTESGRMRRATDRAEEILSGRAEIASVIAHDVRSPVSSIKSIAASTVANYVRLDDAQRLEFVGMIDREAQHVLDVVHQMSVALKIDAGTLDLFRRPTSLATVVRESIERAETDGHEIDVDAAPGIAADVDLKWLAEAIRQGINNAAAFSPEGRPIRISIGTIADDSAVIAIADDGPGIPEERREDVFQRFARWRPPGYEDIPGSGLGLFICRGIVREHGGDATLEEGAERGTILRILLPWSSD